MLLMQGVFENYTVIYLKKDYPHTQKKKKKMGAQSKLREEVRWSVGT